MHSRDETEMICPSELTCVGYSMPWGYGSMRSGFVCE